MAAKKPTKQRKAAQRPAKKAGSRKRPGRGLRRTAREEKRLLTADERQTRAFELYLEGWTFQAIAEELGYADRSSAHRAFFSKAEEVRKTRLRSVKRLIALENARLDKILEGHLGRASRGDSESAFVVIGVIKERAKINGLYAPSRTTLTGDGGGPIRISSPHDALLDRLNRLAESRGAGEDHPGSEPEGG